MTSKFSSCLLAQAEMHCMQSRLKIDCKYCLLVIVVVRIQILNEEFAKRVTRRLDEWARLDEFFFFLLLFMF